MKWELVPVGMHKRNAAENAPQRFKGNLNSFLCGVANDFSLDQ